MSDLPKRNMNQYVEVEYFEKYELLNNLAYEMAIRNNDVKINIKKFLEKFINYDMYDESIFPIYCSSQLKQSQEYVQILLNKYRISPTQLYIEYDFFKDIFLKIHEVFKNINKNSYCALSFDTLFFKKQNNDFKYETINTPNFYNEIAILKDEKVESNKYTHYLVTSFYESIFTYMEDNEGKKIINRKIIPFFAKRPRLHYDFDKVKVRDVEINMTLPKEHIIDFIEKLKDDFDKNNERFKNPLEILGKELNIKTFDLKNMSNKEWADCFFMYDYFKASKDLSTDKYNDIIDQLTIYNGYKIEKSKNEIKSGQAKSKIVSSEVYNQLKNNYSNKVVKKYYSKATIKERLRLMRSLIEDCKYKDLDI